MSKPPRFITFEGGEGAGKTTLIYHIEKFLKAHGLAIVKTREPGGTPFGDQVRSWLLRHAPEVRIGAKAELLLFLSARAQHIEEIIAPALEAGNVVLCDRFNDSTVAYQGAARGQGIEWVRSLCDMVCGKTLPDLTFYLDVDPGAGLARTKKAIKDHAKADEYDRIEAEQIAFHQKVREAFLEIAKKEPARLRCLDANQPQRFVIDEAIAYLSREFNFGN